MDGKNSKSNIKIKIRLYLYEKLLNQNKITQTMRRSELRKLIKEEIQTIKEVTNPKFSSSLASCCRGKMLVSSFSLDDLHLMAKRYFRKSMVDFIKYSDDPEIYSVWVSGKLDPMYRVIKKGTRYNLELI